MKTYKDYITEFKFIDDYKSKKIFNDRFDYIESEYYGVNSFLKAASEWADEITPHADRGLYTILKGLKGKRSINDLSDKDLRKIYKFIRNRGVYDYEDMELMFIGAIDNE